MLDEYIIGNHYRNSPEAADVPVILHSEREARLGGAANVALNLKTLGLAPTLISVVGEDRHGEEIKAILDQSKIGSHLVIDKSRPTTVKQRIVDRSFRQFLRVDTEATEDLGTEAILQIINQLEIITKQMDIAGLVIQDYNKGVITEELIKHLQQLSKEKNIPLFVDPKERNFKLLSESCSVFKPNLKELSKEVGFDVQADEASIMKAINQQSTIAAEKVFITLADKGIFYFDRTQNNHGHIAGIPVEKADVSGAGDTVLATLIWSYLEGSDVPTMANQANKAAAQVCAIKGVNASFILE